MKIITGPRARSFCCRIGFNEISIYPGSLAWFFFFINLFIYLFLAVLSPRFCARAFSSCGEQGTLFIAVRGPLAIAASLVAEHRLQTRRLSSCGSRAQFLRGMWDLPRPGLEPVSPALAGRFSTTAPPGKPPCLVFMGTCGVRVIKEVKAVTSRAHLLRTRCFIYFISF